MKTSVCAALLTITVALALCPSRLQAESGWARHKKIYVVPSPHSTGSGQAGKVTIDAKLDDWDLSGQILIYVYREMSEQQSAKVAMMYDAEAFYVSGVVRDTSPMMNRHDPKVDPDRGWNADVCQLFFNLNPDLGYPVKMNQWSDNKGADKDLAGLYLWYFTDRKEPCLAMFRGLPPRSDPRHPPLGAVPADKFQAAFAKAEDGLGYTFEYRIPWTTLGVPRPLKGGDLSAGAVFVFWSDPAGFQTDGNWGYDVMNYPGFAYQESGSWGKFIFSETGNLPKELAEEGVPPEPPLPLKFTYNMPEDGYATVQLFETNGVVARLLAAQAERKAGDNVELWDGCDDLGKPLPAGTYAWRGLYHKGITTKFCFSSHNSGQPPYKTDDGTGGWGGDHGNPTAVTAAGDFMILTWSASESGWGIIKTDLNGRKQWGINHNATDAASDGERIFVTGDGGYEYAEWVKAFDLKDGRPLNWGNGKLALAPPPGGDKSNDVATAVAYAGGKVYVSWEKRNLVGMYDAKSGNLIETWPVPAPRRLAIFPDGAAAVISGSNVVVGRIEGSGFRVQGGSHQPSAISHQPSAISHQPSAISHQPLTINQHLDNPQGIAVDTNGNIYVANAGKLQNISVFDKDGKYIRSIGKEEGRPAVGRYDPNGIYMPGGMCLDRNGRLWVAETTDSPKRHSVWDAKTGSFVMEFFGASSYFGWAWIDPKHPDEIYCHNVLWKIDWTNNTCRPHCTIWRSLHPDAPHAVSPGGYLGEWRVFTAKNGKQFGWGFANVANMLYIRDGDVFKPFAGTIRPFGAPPSVVTNRTRFPHPAYLWQDANNDQLVQENELVPSPGENSEETFNWIDPDLNAWCRGGFMFKPVRFAPDGRPVYDFSQKIDVKSYGFPWDAADTNALYWVMGRQTRDGKRVWGFRGLIGWQSALNMDMGAPGKLYGLTMPLGVAGKFTGAACYANTYYLFTTDGLYVSVIMRRARDGKLGPDVTASETVTGQLVKPDGMDRYFLLAGDQDGRVTEILGLDTVKPLPGGELTLTAADAKLAADALKEYETKKAKGQRLSIARAEAMGVVNAVGRTLDSGRSFQARAAYNATNLYVTFEVTASDLVNEFSDPQLIFKGGNCLDIQIATDGGADPKRASPAPGDARILVTRQACPASGGVRSAPGGNASNVGTGAVGSATTNPVAVVYRPKIKDFKGTPITLTSPTGKESFDSIEVATNISLAYTKTGGGFNATVTIPLALIGWTPNHGSIVRMDLGYLFGNATGNTIATRAYWSNNSFSANVVNDVPNESRLEPREWGTATVE